MLFNKQHLIFCDKASTFLQRIKGVLGQRKSQNPFFIPNCRLIHTFFMNKSLSLVWISNAFTVIRIDKNIAPWRIRFCRNANHIIEFEDEKALLEIKKGDVLVIKGALI